MNYPKSLFYNFLTVYFANHLLPGIELLNPTRLPHLGTELPFAIGLGLLNSLICPICKLINVHLSHLRLALIVIVLNFAVYALLMVLPLHIHILSIQGYLLASAVVAIGSFATNYLSMRSHRHHHHVRKSSEAEQHSFDEWKNPPSS